MPPPQRARLAEALDLWFAARLAAIEPLATIEAAAQEQATGGEVRALLLALAGGCGIVPREQSGLAVVPKDKRPLLRRLGVTIGALDVFVPALLKPVARVLLSEAGLDPRPLNPGMEAVVAGGKALPAGYRRAGSQAIRVDMAEKLFRAAHDARAKAPGRGFALDPALATSMGLKEENFLRLMREAGFRRSAPRPLAESAFGPPAPPRWSWQPPRKDETPRRGARPRPSRHNAFAALAELVR
jgi:ATP-dependent RNA helicase SUPV3L1/SUV3